MALRNLDKCLDDERLVFGKDDFEECVLKEVSFEFSEKELQRRTTNPSSLIRDRRGLSGSLLHR